MLHANLHDLTQAPFWGAVLQIVFVNLLLSGDNAVVIAMACRGLPARQRRLGLVIGAGVAIGLLIVFTMVMTRLLEIRYLKIAGGLALLYIAAGLLVPHAAGNGEGAAATRLWHAVGTIVVADLVMSFDDVLAIVQIAKGNIALLAVGLTVAVPLIIGGAALISALLARVPVLIWAGAVLLGWVGGQTIVSDLALASLLRDFDIGRAALLGGCAGAAIAVAAGAGWRRRASRRAGAEQAGAPPDD